MKTFVGSSYRLSGAGNKNKTFIEILIVFLTVAVIVLVVAGGIRYVENVLQRIAEYLISVLNY